MLYATVLGDVPAITEYLHKYPNEVNVKFNGMAAIHKAAMAGKIPVLKILVELGADIELEDGFGQRSLHHCAARSVLQYSREIRGQTYYMLTFEHYCNRTCSKHLFWYHY
jgi:ankyrin repeat protein